MKICLETSTFRSRFAGIAYYTLFLSRSLLEHETDITLSGFDGSRFRPITPGLLDAATAADRVS